MRKTTKIKGQSMSFFENNGQGMPVFLVHGNFLSSDIFRHQINSQQLSNYRIIAVDLPGHGESFRSVTPDLDYSLINLVEFLVEFINSFRFDEFYLFGNSLGGHLLINCLPYLNGVKGIAISGTPPLTSPPDMAACYLPNPAMPLAFKPELSQEEIKLLATIFCSEPFDDIHSIMDMIKNTDTNFRRVVGAELMTGKNAEEIEVLKKANVPLAILHGEKDSIVNPDYFKTLKVKKWGDKIHFIQNAGHLPFFENGRGLIRF